MEPPIANSSCLPFAFFIGSRMTRSSSFTSCEERGFFGVTIYSKEIPARPKNLIGDNLRFSNLSVACRTKVMRIVHKCRRQGSGSASPKGRARALAPSQSYRFVNNSHDLPTAGRRPQISPEISSCLCKVGRAKSPQSSGRSPGEAVGEIIPCLELAQAEFITKQRSPAASWLDLKQLTEPHEFILASSPLQDREKP